MFFKIIIVLVLLILEKIEVLNIPPRIYLVNRASSFDFQWISDNIILIQTHSLDKWNLTCNSSTPIGWDFNSLATDYTNDIKSFTRQRIVDANNPMNTSSYIFQISLQINGIWFPQYQGHYICNSLLDSSIYASVLVLQTNGIRYLDYFLTEAQNSCFKDAWERAPGPYQVNKALKIRPLLNQTVVLVPCIFPYERGAKPSLFILDNTFKPLMDISDESYVTYNFTKGFYLRIEEIDVLHWTKYACILTYLVRGFNPYHITTYIPVLLEPPEESVFSPEADWFQGDFQTITCASKNPIEIRPNVDQHQTEFNVTYFQNYSSPYFYNAIAEIIRGPAASTWFVGCYNNISNTIIKTWGRVLLKNISIELGDYSQGNIKCTGYPTHIKLLRYECDEPAECNFLKDILKNIQRKDLTLTRVSWDEHNISPKPLVVQCFENFVTSKIYTILLDLDRNFFVLNENMNHDPSKFVRLNQLQSHAYLLEEIKFTCVAIRFLFANVHWAFRFKNQSMVIVTGKMDEIQFNGFTQQRTTILQINDKNISQVICYAPYANSFEWAWAQHSIIVKDKEIPKIAGLSIEYKDISKIDEDMRLTCDATGHPKPNITWEGSFIENITGNIENKILRSDTNASSVLILSGEATQKEENFICIATNSFGSSKKIYKLFLSKTLHPWVIPSIIVSIIFIVILTILLFWRQRRKFIAMKNLLTESDIKDFLEGSSDPQGKKESGPQGTGFPDKYKINRDNFVIDGLNMLGYGAFGIVYKGTYIKSKQQETTDNNLNIEQQPISVAIKTLKQNANVQYVKSLLDEIKTMGFVGTHNNIVDFIGACVDNIRFNQIWVVLEFCDNGSLECYLRKWRSKFQDTDVSKIENSNGNPPHPGKITTNHLLQWTQHITDAMKYLSEKKVIHGDLATRNVLLTKNLIAKVADFGLAKKLYNLTIYTRKGNLILPWAWMAIESLRDKEFSIQSDVWSFGVTLWEIFSLAETPYGGLGFTMEFINMLKLGLRLPKPSHASDQVYEVMSDCWNIDPTKRPKIETIGIMLNLIGKSSVVVQSLPSKEFSSQEEEEEEHTHEPDDNNIIHSSTSHDDLSPTGSAEYLTVNLDPKIKTSSDTEPEYLDIQPTV